MSEELNEKETTAEAPAEVAPVVETETAPAPEAETVPQEGAVEEAVATPTQPQVIVQRERGFSHYVGFALLSVLCICFYFMPGIAITFAISLIPGISLGAVAAWTFSAIFSVIAWAIFKMKIKGFKKSFYFYIGLCVLISILLVVIEILTEETNVFAKIVSLLCGAS
ncbi:hypothetical protein SAMN05720470_104133 [Fibrobacter sp. UWOV1]|uniref:hypothetical protein n=1 Tax=Fibrobacter sp. UWOV1 TaxID=1896215 RepID=UPI00091FE299|nr:hypothetical protein [Fibrobacter sp. UWOV1]SHL05338.1 hypothetical protein SAMN05720470_104133 [Fibrobacter sp. UWOV1]